MLKKMLSSIALASFFAVGVTAPVQAQGKKQEYVIVWYTDESQTAISGQRIGFCDGTTFRSGVPTLFEEETYYGC
ncbi:hypothetical protein [Sphingomonas albertensis]|uniref:Uncharacterized protein n=1 Tax=Sphingomonas albertensis TaxID=2762591 RepID=A0ABR7AKI3_9SPHN|nr:hypothetical protein [Sphingomonas albertensis]MBC3940963.1 hypothetical protein [Sphingomonas albertensis]